MPEIEGLIPVIVGIALICLIALFFGWLFTHPLIFIPVILLIAFFVHRARARESVMQLKIQRSQRAGGVLGGTVYFCLDVRADYSPEEKDNINKYKLGGEVIYNSQAARKHIEQASAHLDRTQSDSFKEKFAGLARGAVSAAMAKMSLNISIASLGRGHHIECKDLEELLEAEETVRNACKNVTRFLEIASTFDGSEVVIDYEKGEERVHITQHAPPLIEYQADVPGETPQPARTNEGFEEMGRDFGRLGAMLQNRWLAFEAKLISALAAKGQKLDQTQVRVFCGIAAFLILLLLYEIL